MGTFQVLKPHQCLTFFNDIPSCFFTSTSLPKSSNNLDLYVCECQMFPTGDIKDYISNKRIYCMRDIRYKCELPKLESNTFWSILEHLQRV